MDNGQWTMDSLSLADRAILSELQELVCDVTRGLEEYRLSEVGERLYSFTWDYFCDWYLELSKGEANVHVLVHAVRTLLTLLHPYCPFVTEGLWEHFKPRATGMLMKESWPATDEKLRDDEAEASFCVLIEVISAIRQIRSEQGIEPRKTIDVIIHAAEHLELIRSQRAHIMRLGHIHDWTLDAIPAHHENAASVLLKGIEVHVPLAGVIDIAAERRKLEREKARLERFIAAVQSKLGSKDFVKRAPENVVADERRKLMDAEAKLRKIEDRLKVL